MSPLSSFSASILRTTVQTRMSYPELVVAFESALGRWEPSVAKRLVQSRATWAEVRREVSQVSEPRGLMIISQADQGALTSLSGVQKQCKLYLVGNPVIASEILAIDPRASLYVPFRVCLYQEAEAVSGSISYDRPSSSLATLGRAELADVGLLLDGKIDDLATTLAEIGF